MLDLLERPLFTQPSDGQPPEINNGPSGGDPNEWCTSKCSTSGCDNQCSGNKGHNGSHACFSH